MKYQGMELDERVSWKEITTAGLITGGGTSKQFETGDWRNQRPEVIEEKCKHCLLCLPVCPDSSIAVKDGKRDAFDYKHCKGCGICASVCPFGAIVMRRED